MTVDITKIGDRNVAQALDGAFNKIPINAYVTAANTTSFTATTAQVAAAQGIITFDVTGTLASGQNITTPTAAQIIAALGGPTYSAANVGHSYILSIVNNSSAAFSWTLVGGTGVTVTGTATVAQHTFRDFCVTLTNITVGSEAVTMQNVGSGTN